MKGQSKPDRPPPGQVSGVLHFDPPLQLRTAHGPVAIADHPIGSDAQTNPGVTAGDILDALTGTDTMVTAAGAQPGRRRCVAGPAGS